MEPSNSTTGVASTLGSAVSFAVNAATSAAAKVFPTASADSRGSVAVYGNNNNGGVARQGQQARPEVHLTAVPFTQVGRVLV
jgi:hypothetical protein